MESLIQHFQAAGFSGEVSRLAAAPKRASTNRVYDDRWLHLAYWAVDQEIDLIGDTAAQIATLLYSLFAALGLKRS